MDFYENNSLSAETEPEKEPEAIDTAESSPEPALVPTVLAPAPAEPEESPTLVIFTKPYKFEGKTYKEIDLAGLESMSASDMCAAEKHLNRSGMFSPLPEMTAEYVCYIAAQTSDLPIEFFKALPPRDFIRVKNKVTNFFYGED